MADTLFHKVWNTHAAFSRASAESSLFLELSASPDSSRTVGQAMISVGMKNSCTMSAMASAPQYFYSDYHQSASASTCVAGQPVTSLSGIFTAIAADLSTARLIPNNTQ